MPNQESSWQLISVQSGRIRELQNSDGKRWESAFNKEPVPKAQCQISTAGLEGDQQADQRHHGGPDKALLVYSAEHWPLWQDRFNMEVEPGGFGENLTVSGGTEHVVCIGDIWQWGDLRLQITQPRQPCWKLAHRWNRPELLKEVLDTQASGWYLRVLEAGQIEPDEGKWPSLTRTESIHPEWTVARATVTYLQRKTEPEAAAALASLPELSTAWRQDLA